MFKKLAGWFFIVVGFVGGAFFKNYKGSLIPLSSIWFFISILFCIVGFFLIYTSKLKKNTRQEKYNKERLNRLKLNGEKILLTVENCEIKENNYYEEIMNESDHRAQAIDALFDPNRNYKEHHVEQSAIIYTYFDANKKVRMVSATFPFDGKILAGYIERKMICLYVNRFDNNDFAFDIAESRLNKL